MLGRLTACLYTSQLQTTHGPILVQAPWSVPMVTIVLMLQPSCPFSVRMTESSPSQSWINCTQHIKSIPLTTNLKKPSSFSVVICVVPAPGVFGSGSGDPLGVVPGVSFAFGGCDMMEGEEFHLGLAGAAECVRLCVCV